MDLSKETLAPQRVHIAYTKKNREMSNIERSYINAAYWAAFLRIEDIHLTRKFLYLFIMDIGIFPFEKCYDGKSIISSCVTAGKVELLKELL